MWKIIAAVAALIMVGSIIVGFMNHTAHQERLAELARKENTLEQRKDSLATVEAEIAEREATIIKLEDETNRIQTEKVDLEAKLVQTNANLETREGEVEAAKKQADKLKVFVADLPTVQGLQREQTQVTVMIDEKDIEIQGVQGEIATQQAARDRAQKVADDLVSLRQEQQNGIIRGGFRSNVSKAFNQWGFVVFPGGNNSGMTQNAILDVYRGSQPICKLVVTSFEAGRTVADIVPGSLAPGQIVQVGDTVIQQERSFVAAPAAAATEPAPESAPASATSDPFGGAMSTESAAPAASDTPTASDPFATPATDDPFGGSSSPDPFQ